MPPKKVNTKKRSASGNSSSSNNSNSGSGTRKGNNLKLSLFSVGTKGYKKPVKTTKENTKPVTVVKTTRNNASTVANIGAALGDKKTKTPSPVASVSSVSPPPAPAPAKTKKAKKEKETLSAKLERLKKELEAKEIKKVANAATKKLARNAEKAAKKKEAENAARAARGNSGPTAAELEAGEAAHKAALAEAEDREKDLKDEYEEEKKAVDEEFKVLRKSNSTIPIKGAALVLLAKIRANGFSLSIKDHLHLTKHIQDKKTRDIVAVLKDQARSLSSCDACALEKYLLNV